MRASAKYGRARIAVFALLRIRSRCMNRAFPSPESMLMQKEIRRAAIVRRPHRDCCSLSESVEKTLAERGVVSVSLEASLSEDGSYSYATAGLENVDLAVSLGGDGTLLATARLFYGTGIPVFAVNSGTFGFLTAISRDEILRAIDALFLGQAEFEERLMLTASVRRGGSRQGIGEFRALNEVVVTQQGMPGMLSLDAWVNGEFLCGYRADGLIVATPTGSTGYSLSASGPILMPTLDNMIITPVCPHSVASRPFVVGGGDVVTIRVGSCRVRPFLSIDTQESMALEEGDEIEVRRAPHPLTLVRSSERSSLEVLRTKLAWNSSPGTLP
jgi:NAD+ kinase